MHTTRLLLPALALLSLFLLSPPSAAQFGDQRYMLTDGERQELSAGRDQLRKTVDALREQSRRTGKPRADQLPDVEIYLDAVDRNLGQNLFFSKANADQAKSCLKEGESRAAALKNGETPWERQKGTVVLGYRSEVDGTAQPYQVYVPEGYDFAAPKPLRLDIFLHGRSAALNEIAFVSGKGWVRSSFGTDTLPFLALYPYGRANNGWRWAGERDMFEALADARRRYPADPDRILLRGFSMGGHGTWHIGLQHPGDWAAMSPGAGFTDTINYKGIKDPMPEWQRQLLNLYDPIAYAANAADLPVLAYIGDQDPALPQHQQMYAALRKENVPFKEFLGPETPHRYHPMVLQEILTNLATVRREPDAPVRFVTYTLRWPDCKWIQLEGLQRHWQRAEVSGQLLATGTRINTTNISAMRVTLPASATGARASLSIDGQAVKAAPTPGKPTSLVKVAGQWQVGELKGLRKKPGLQGPIDDALFGPLLVVSGTGKPIWDGMDRWLKQELARFREGWGIYFRGTLPERTDKTLTAADIRDHNLYLFGDPGSNAVLRRLLPKLPLTWTREKIEIAGKEFSPDQHLPVLIFPNPENPERYVVLNTGMTFSRADWTGSNALQYPHLPDYAVIRYNPDAFSDNRAQDTLFAGFFDEQWRAPGEAK